MDPREQEIRREWRGEKLEDSIMLSRIVDHFVPLTPWSAPPRRMACWSWNLESGFSVDILPMFTLLLVAGSKSCWKYRHSIGLIASCIFGIGVPFLRIISSAPAVLSAKTPQYSCQTHCLK